MTLELKLTFSFRMSVTNRDEPGTPEAPPMTPPGTPTGYAQGEDVSQDTGRKNERNSVGETTEVSLVNNNEDPEAVVRELVEETPSTPQSVCVRNLGGNTPKIPLIPLNLIDEDHRDPRISTSPATSTPGASPLGSNGGLLRNSELQVSEESVIESSLTIDKSKLDEVKDDRVVVKLTSTSLHENSEVENESQDVNDSSWETTLGESMLKEMGERSCVANRTRSHTEEIRKKNLTKLEETGPTSMEDSFVILDHKATDSLNLPRPGKDEISWDNMKEWYEELKKLDISMDKASRIRGPNKEGEMTQMYKEKTAEVARKNEGVIQVTEGAAVDMKKEKEMKRVTFVVEEPAYSTALQEVIKALETLVNMNLCTAPTRNIENIIRIILSICIDYSTQVQAMQETMRSMAVYIRELLLQRYKMEALEEENRKMIEEKEEAMTEISNLKKYNDIVKGMTDSLVSPAQSRNRDLVAEIIVYKLEITELESSATVREEKYINAYTRKEHYKERTLDLEKKVKAMEAEMKEEKEKAAEEKDDNEREIQDLLNGYETMSERAQKLGERMVELERTHKEEMTDMIEKKEVNSEMENGRRLIAEEKVADLESEIRGIRTDLYKKLRSKDKDITVAERKLEKSKKTLMDKERVNNSLRDIIELQKKDIELKAMEIGAYKHFSFLFGEEDPKKIFDPDYPEKRYKPLAKSKNSVLPNPKTSVEKDDGFGSDVNTTTDVSNAEFQSSTAGIYGDTEAGMDTTQGPDDITLETQNTGPRGEKRKMVEMVMSEKKDTKEKEKIEESSEESCSTGQSGDEKEPNKKKRMNRNRMSKKGMIQKELNIQMEELKKEHCKQVKELEKRNEEGMENLKRELEQKSKQEIESLRKSLNTEEENVMEKKPEEAIENNFRRKEARGNEELAEGAPGLKEIQDPKVSSHKNGQEDQIIPQTPVQINNPTTETPASQNSEKQGDTTPANCDPSTQKREEGRPLIVPITEENRNRISINDMGLIQNENGTLTMTPQYWTWSSNKSIQIQKLQDTHPGFPAHIRRTGHPEATQMDIGWTHEGEWILIPVDKDDKGPIYKDTNIARIEKYINLDGDISRAVSYGEEDTKLKIWFDIEELKKAFPHWIIPNPCPYYNGKKFSPGVRRPPKGNNKPNFNSGPKTNPLPRDQSNKDIQGRGGNQQQSKGYYNNQYKGKVETYQDWDSQQRAGAYAPRTQQKWEQESWDNYQHTAEEERSTRPKDYQSWDQTWDQSWDQQNQRNNSQQQHPKPQRNHQNREDHQRDPRERGRERGNSNQGYDSRAQQEGYQTREYAIRRTEEFNGARPRDGSRPRHREASRDRQGERRYRERSPSPQNSGRGRGGGQRGRSNSSWSESGRGRVGSYEKRGNGASYGGS